MRLIKYLTIILLFAPISCIEQYYPKYEKNAIHKYIVTGEINNTEGYQYITISMTSPVDRPTFLPLTDCIVEVIDDNGNTFMYDEFEDGKYRSFITSNFLTPGTSYKLRVRTPAGETIESDYDQMPYCPEVDTVYYERINIPTSNPDLYVNGVQFYIDIKGAENDSRYYKWEIIETFEYHAYYPIQIYYDGKLNKIDPDYSKNICYQTQPIKSIYTINTSSLQDNSYKKLPLHFVDNTTQKLQHQYSIEIVQYALSDEAHTYWNQLQQNSTDQGGLFDKQPFNIVSNYKSVNNSEISILGFFYACSKTKKRYFFNNIPNLTFNFLGYCEPQKLEMGFAPYSPEDYPIYCIIMADGSLGVADAQCFDCTQLGGTTEKPTYWPN